jgi:similar to stage IV sporulation protein
MLKSLQRYLLGTLRVSIRGSGCERFLNLVHGEKFNIFDVCRDDDGCVTFGIDRKNFRRLRPLVRKSHVKIHIQKKLGLPQRTRNYRHRFGLILGVIIIVVSLYISSLFIWDVQVSGCESISEQEVLTVLSENGFTAGGLKRKYNIREIENNFLKHNDKISWISINIKGTTAFVEVREKSEKPELIDASEPCSIYAARDGVIASVSDYMGYSLVKPGDTVTAGDLIVTGDYTDKYGTQYKLHSYAKVMAYTTHTKTVTVPLKASEHVRTGNFKNKYSLKLIRFSVPLYFNGKILYNNYDVTKSEKFLRLTDNFVLPISICKTTYTEIENFEYTKSKETALYDAYEQLRDFEYNLVGIRVLDREYEEQINEDSVTVKVMLNCYEDIGISRKIN